MKPGIYTGMSFAQYLAIDAINSSMIRDTDEHCAAYAQWARKQPQVVGREWTTQKRGTALHAKLLEPAKFEASYYFPSLGCDAVLGSGSRKGEHCGSSTGTLRIGLDGEPVFLCGKHDDGLLLIDGRVAIPESGALELQGMAEAIRLVAGPALDAATHRELTLVWEDEDTGLLMKARPDFVSGNTLFDIKALADIAPQRWGKIMLNAGMHFQAVHYLAGARACGLDVEHFAWVSVRNAAPYIAVVQPPMDPASIDVSTTLWRDRVNSIKEWQDSKAWPSYGVPEYSSLPDWFINTFTVAP